MVFAGETVCCEGEITSIAAEGDCDVVRVTQRVRVAERIAVEPASAEIVLPRQ